MSMTEKGLARLKSDEGFRADIYQDTLGHPTIGYGTLLEGWSEDFAEQVLRVALDTKAADLARRWPFLIRLDFVRRDALLNMAYQLGVGGVLGFRKTLRYLEDGSYRKAAAEALDSLWARQTPNRAQRIAFMIEHGRYPGE